MMRKLFIEMMGNGDGEMMMRSERRRRRRERDEEPGGAARGAVGPGRSSRRRRGVAVPVRAGRDAHPSPFPIPISSRPNRRLRIGYHQRIVTVLGTSYDQRSILLVSYIPLARMGLLDPKPINSVHDRRAAPTYK